ncbi:hypothetical protein AYI69_g11496 [Smittium culicis]|uniref:Integrase catalytic domain-containing protein n=1 Tax=Smittium culicis TaxID=133412 RepID=A0A1R1WY69_9FUNG|nr:hypothetical protein AYI69_g11496 [Smittium culicis]
MVKENKLYRKPKKLGDILVLTEESSEEKIRIVHEETHNGMDEIGPISPVKNNDNRYILTAIDYNTKWPISLAVGNIQSEW